MKARIVSFRDGLGAIGVSPSGSGATATGPTVGPPG
jgi:hypothetical protein